MAEGHSAVATVSYINIPIRLHYKGCVSATPLTYHFFPESFTQFYATKSEHDRNMRKEYETQLMYLQHLLTIVGNVIQTLNDTNNWFDSCSGTNENEHSQKGLFWKPKKSTSCSRG